MDRSFITLNNVEVQRGTVSSKWLCYVLVPLNLYGDYLERVFGIKPLVINVFSMLMYAILLFFLEKKSKIGKKYVAYFLINSVICLGHFATSSITSELKQLCYITLFVMIASIETGTTYNLLRKTILFLTIPMSIDALISARTIRAMGYGIYNVRLLTMMDKPYYTLIFSIAIIILIHGIINLKARKTRIAYFVWICVLAYVQYMLIQSKTSILAVVLALFAEYMLVYRNVPRKMLYCISVIILGVMVIVLFLPYIKIPNYIMDVVNFVTGNYSIMEKSYYTFIVRKEVLENVMTILSRYPLFGVGFGSYYKYAFSHGMLYYTRDIYDMESSVLSILGEGGLIYFIVVFLVFAVLTKRLLKLCRLKRLNRELIGVGLCMLILLVGNDFMSTFFWCLIGSLWASTKIC